MPTGIARIGIRRTLPCRVPVARVLRVAIASIAVIGNEGVADEVEAADDVRGQIHVRPKAGVEHGHGDACARGDVPCGDQIETADRVEVVPLLVVAGVVGRERMLQQKIWLGVQDVRILCESVDEIVQFRLRDAAIQLNHVRTSG